MNRTVRLMAIMLGCELLAGCGGAPDNICTITAAVTPANATADHGAPSPANQVQYSLVSSVKGFCPLVPDIPGSWSTSDPMNTTIGNQAPIQGLATCLHATSTPATITNNGSVQAHSFSPATLTCK